MNDFTWSLGNGKKQPPPPPKNMMYFFYFLLSLRNKTSILTVRKRIFTGRFKSHPPSTDGPLKNQTMTKRLMATLTDGPPKQKYKTLAAVSRARQVTTTTVRRFSLQTGRFLPSTVHYEYRLLYVTNRGKITSVPYMYVCVSRYNTVSDGGGAIYFTVVFGTTPSFLCRRRLPKAWYCCQWEVCMYVCTLKISEALL